MWLGPPVSHTGLTDRVSSVFNALSETKAAAEARDARASLRHAARDAEARVEELTKACRELEAHLADPVAYNGDQKRLEDLQMRYDTLRRALSDAETRWLSAQEALEGS